MFSALSLGVFEALEAGGHTAAELAATLTANTDALERLLDACVGLQLLAKRDGRYSNTPCAATYLCKKSPDRLTGYINFSNNAMWKLWSHLEDAIREGTHRWKQTYGWDGPIFSHFFHTPDALREFLMGMHGFGCISSPHVVSAHDLGRFTTFVDLGGATGHLTLAACRRFPHMKGVVFDLPEAMDLAREIVGDAGMLDRIALQGGDFFTDPLPAGDLYALGRILHDWNEEKILRLLGRIHQSLPPGGGILIAEKLLLEDKTGPRWSQLQSLNMLACTEGKERTLAEYEGLLQRCGFSNVVGCRTASPLDAVLAIKAE
jgi:acetylserotonin N-methyltransferase